MNHISNQGAGNSVDKSVINNLNRRLAKKEAQYDALIEKTYAFLEYMCILDWEAEEDGNAKEIARSAKRYKAYEQMVCDLIDLSEK